MGDYLAVTATSEETAAPQVSVFGLSVATDVPDVQSLEQIVDQVNWFSNLDATKVFEEYGNALLKTFLTLGRFKSNGSSGLENFDIKLALTAANIQLKIATLLSNFVDELSTLLKNKSWIELETALSTYIKYEAILAYSTNDILLAEKLKSVLEKVRALFEEIAGLNSYAEFVSLPEIKGGVQGKVHEESHKKIADNLLPKARLILYKFHTRFGEHTKSQVIDWRAVNVWYDQLIHDLEVLSNTDKEQFERAVNEVLPVWYDRLKRFCLTRRGDIHVEAFNQRVLANFPLNETDTSGGEKRVFRFIPDSGTTAEALKQVSQFATLVTEIEGLFAKNGYAELNLVLPSLSRYYDLIKLCGSEGFVGESVKVLLQRIIAAYEVQFQFPDNGKLQELYLPYEVKFYLFDFLYSKLLIMVDSRIAINAEELTKSFKVLELLSWKLGMNAKLATLKNKLVVLTRQSSPGEA